MDAHGVIPSVFGAPRALIGMVHLGALPGSPTSRDGMSALVEAALAEARLYQEAGFNGLMIENMHDRPYFNGAAGPEVVATMAIIGRELRRHVDLPLGVQVLAAANREAMAVAHACGASFVRVEGFVFAHVADEGLIESDAAALLRYRRSIGADGIRVFADVKKKHASHAVTADLDLAETARAAEFCLADGVIVTGVATGREADVADVQVVRDAVHVPTFVGSGITAENLDRYAAADGFIVGSAGKRGGVWSNPLDRARVRAIAAAFERLDAAP